MLNPMAISGGNRGDLSMKIVVFGASGNVGSVITERLKEAGHTLLLISQGPTGILVTSSEIRFIATEDWESQAQGFDVFLFMPGIARRPKEDQTIKDDMDVAIFLLEASNRAGIPRFVCQLSFRDLVRKPGEHSLDGFLSRRDWVNNYFSGHVDVVYTGILVHHTDPDKLWFFPRISKIFEDSISSVLSAFLPMTSVESIVEYFSHPDPLADGRRSILTDSKSENLTYRIWQAALNLTFVVSVALLSFPLFLFWTAIVVQSGRPGFFLQDRIGRGGKSFKCAKLRTMKKGTESVGTHLVRDEAITEFGRFLRRFKLDELPQAVNIASGQMCLVGPRPSLPGQVEVIEARETSGVMGLKPGLTGWAQVKGIDMSEPGRIAELDAQYLRLQSVWLDLLILKRTLFHNEKS